MKKHILIITFALIIINISFTQEQSSSEDVKPLPIGYREITLGMSFENAKKALAEDSIFGYRGERDISLLQGKNRSLIETSASGIIKRSWLQFYEEKLYILTIQMNADKIDYYSIYSALTKKYGEPLIIDPKKAVWKDENVSMLLERPLIIKYIDLKVFNELLDKSQTEKTYIDILRKEFIDDF